MIFQNYQSIKLLKLSSITYTKQELPRFISQQIYIKSCLELLEYLHHNKEPIKAKFLFHVLKIPKWVENQLHIRNLKLLEK